MTGSTSNVHFETNDHATDSPSKRRSASNFLLDATQGRLLDAVNDGKLQLAGTLDGLVQAAHEFAAKLEGGAGGPVADIAKRVAGTVSEWQQSIETKSVEDLLDAGRDFVRQSPMLSMTLSVAAGFLVSRMLKSSPGAQ